MTNKIEYIVLNVASAGWVMTHALELIPPLVTALVGLSFVFLNISKGISFLRKKKDETDNL